MPTRRKTLSAVATRKELVQLDEMIRSGRAAQAREQIVALSAKLLPRETAIEIASLARRAEIPDTAIKILAPVVRPSRALATPATANEIAEYAASLVKIGATTEALSLLSKLDPAACPSALLYTAYARIAVWDYHASIPLLESYVEHAGSDSYLKFVARVNLAASLTSERRHDDALRLIDALLEEAKAMSFTLLTGNLLEIRAQNAIHASNWKEAEESLAFAEDSLGETGARFGLFVRKWKTVARLLCEGARPDIVLELKQIRYEAKKQTHWETLRDCDRALALATHDLNLVSRLFFGTPFESFRRKLVSDWGPSLDLPESYDWKWQGGKGPRIDLELGHLNAAREPIRPGGLVHRLLVALSSDFYRPQRIACLFAALYPGEYFSPAVAALRVHQACNRLRLWFTKNKLPLSISENSGYYRLEGTGPFTLQVPRPDRSPETPHTTQLKRRWANGEEFNLREAATLLKLSPRSVLRLTNELREAGSLTREGSGSAVKYRFVVTPKSPIAKTS